MLGSNSSSVLEIGRENRAQIVTFENNIEDNEGSGGCKRKDRKDKCRIKSQNERYLPPIDCRVVLTVIYGYTDWTKNYVGKILAEDRIGRRYCLHKKIDRIKGHPPVLNKGLWILDKDEGEEK